MKKLGYFNNFGDYLNTFVLFHKEMGVFANYSNIVLENRQ